jgi:CRP-like cAMP-binding protein/Fe-S-cluster-containing hydrogenase component 2
VTEVVTADQADISIERMREYPFLGVLSETILRKLRPHLAEKRFAPGDLLLRLGDYSDAAYYLAQGQVEVRVPDAAQSQEEERRHSGQTPETRRWRTHVAKLFTPRRSGSPARAETSGGTAARRAASFERVTLTAGDIFGEIGALSRYPVTADVVAASDVLVLMITTPGLRLMLKQRELADFRKSIDERYRARTLASHLRSVALLAGLDEQLIDRLRDRAELLAFDPGARIVEQGAPTDGFYLVRGGHVKVSADSGTQAGRAVTYLRKGDHAGEIGLLTGEPWPFSLVAIEHVELVRLPPEEFAAILSASPSAASMLRSAVSATRAQLSALSENPSASKHIQMAVDTGLINGQSVLLIDMHKCTGCDDCVRACADTHGGTPRFIRQGTMYEHWNVPVACYQCSDPVCMIGCPTAAITRPLGGIEVTINDGACIGCGNCVRRCPWGNIISVPRATAAAGRSAEVATKCDLCIGRDGGPACVQMCPHGAATRISFQDSATLARVFTGSPEPRSA